MPKQSPTLLGSPAIRRQLTVTDRRIVSMGDWGRVGPSARGRQDAMSSRKSDRRLSSVVGAFIVGTHPDGRRPPGPDEEGSDARQPLRYALMHNASSPFRCWCGFRGTRRLVAESQTIPLGIGSWWIARVIEPFIYVIAASGAIFGMAYGFQILCIFGSMWFVRAGEKSTCTG